MNAVEAGFGLRPRVGMIVMYTPMTQEMGWSNQLVWRPAIVTKVISDTQVNLHVIEDADDAACARMSWDHFGGAGPRLVQNVEFNAAPQHGERAWCFGDLYET